MSTAFSEQAGAYQEAAVRVLIMGRPGAELDHIKRVLGSASDRYAISSIAPDQSCTRYFVSGPPQVLFIQDKTRPGPFEHFLAEMVLGYSDMRVIVFGHGMSDDYLFRLIDAGVHGYINERMLDKHVLRALATVSEGRYWFERHVMEELITRLSVREHMRARVNTLGARLSRRETEVLSLIMDGMPTSEIAERIFLSHQGVKAHLTSLFRKFKVKNRAQLILAALNEVSPVVHMTRLVQQELQAVRLADGKASLNRDKS